MAFVHQTRLKRLGSEIGSAHREIRVSPAFIRRIASTSNSRSSVVLPLDTDDRVFENTTLSAARQMSVKSTIQGGWSATGAVSQ